MSDPYRATLEIVRTTLSCVSADPYWRDAVPQDAAGWVAEAVLPTFMARGKTEFVSHLESCAKALTLHDEVEW